MSDDFQSSCTRNELQIDATPEAIYNAFVDPALLLQWQAPGEMTAKIHEFDARVGGGYRMSLFYPESGEESRGKTTDLEDCFTSRFVELSPSQIIQEITFDTDDPAFAGEMTMIATFEPKGDGTLVTIFFEDLPSGIRPEDNEAGTQQSLEKLAKLVQRN